MNTMTMNDIKAMLTEILDGTLDADARRRCEAHLAGSAEARSLVERAERADQLMKAEAFIGRLDGGLPEGFEAAVLARTTRAGRGRDERGGRGGAVIGRIGWLGWFAAVAAMIVAWLGWWPGVLNLREQEAMSNRVATNDGAGGDNAQADRGARGSEGRAGHGGNGGAMVSYPARSWVSTAGFSSTQFAMSEATPAWDDDEDAYENEFTAGASDEQGGGGGGDRPSVEMDRSMADADGAPAERSAPERTRIVMNEDDALTLESAARVLEALAAARLEYGFADVERARRIAEYDELLDRLATARERVDARVRPTVFAAESIVLRLVHGPISRSDARDLGETIRESGLADALRNAAKSSGSGAGDSSGAGKA